MTEKELCEIIPHDYYLRQYILFLPKQRQEEEVAKYIRKSESSRYIDRQREVAPRMSMRPLAMIGREPMHTMAEVINGFYRL